VIEAVVSFATDLIQNKQLWSYLQEVKAKVVCNNAFLNKTAVNE